MVYHVNNSYKKLRIRLEIVNYFNDNRPLIIRQISLEETFKLNVVTKIKNCGGANWDPNPRPDKIIDYIEFKEIPVLSAIKYQEVGNSTNSDFISDNQYLEIGGNKSFIVDFEVWTKEEQHKIFCTEECAGKCEVVQALTFPKWYTTLTLLVDKPDYNNNTNIRFGVKDYIAVVLNN